MDEDVRITDVFATDDLWKQSKLTENEKDHDSALFPPLQVDIPAIIFDHPYAPKHNLDRELRLPDLETFEFGPLPEPDNINESITSTETPQLEPDEDVWEVALDLGPADKDIQFYTWESFENGQRTDHKSPYMTEWGPEAYDSALAKDDAHTNAGKVIRDDVLLRSLWNLGLGRSSALFQYNARSKTFEAIIEHGRPSGVGLYTAHSLINQFIHAGTTFLRLKSFVERTFAAQTSIPARVALATSISSILSAIEDHLGGNMVRIKSLMELQHYFTRPRQILNHLNYMVDAVGGATGNEQLASVLHHRLLELEDMDDGLRRLSCRVLNYVAQPSLELFEEWLGLRPEQPATPIAERGSFVTLDPDVPEQTMPTYLYRSEMMPTLISADNGHTIFETGVSLRFLRTHHPDHPLARADSRAHQSPKFVWAHEWQKLQEIASKAAAYERKLRDALLSSSVREIYDVDESASLLPPDTSTSAKGFILGIDDDLDKYFEQCIRSMNAAPKSNAQAVPDDLVFLTDQILGFERHDLAFIESPPPLAITPSLSFHPLIAARARVVNAATLRLFFRSHQLQHHLSIQKQYHLLGDGVFSSLLATALLDPERESAERINGKMRSGIHMGLQLGTRTSWPPASSELRLALRGVLSESYFTSTLYDISKKDKALSSPSTTTDGRDTDELPGQLNFAIRNLTEAEQEKVMDPDALPALDFLRLQYVPPSPLNLVITSSSLDKYDIIFKFLLRLLRVLFVVSHLPRHYSDLDSRSFRLEAHHFVTALTHYVFQTGIAEHWNVFDTYVSSVSSRLHAEDAAGELGTRVTDSVASIRDAHERCLDNISFALFLRKRQRKIIGLVEDIFEAILLFAKYQRQPNVEHSQNVCGLYANLKGKIRVFTSVCRGLAGKKEYAQGKGTAEDAMDRLLLGLEGNGYFAIVSEGRGARSSKAS